MTSKQLAGFLCASLILASAVFAADAPATVPSAPPAQPAVLPAQPAPLSPQPAIPSPQPAALSPQPSAPPAQPSTPAAQPAPEAKTNLLGPEFSSDVYGVAFRPPPDCIEIHKPSPDTIVEFDEDKNQWIILARQVPLEKPVPLTIHNDQFGRPEEGLLEDTTRRITQNTPGAEIIQDDAGARVFNVGRIRVGAIFVRFVNATQQRKLLLEALVEVPDADHRLYYFIDFIANARPKDADPKVADPGEKLAYDTFSQMIDSIRILDRTKIVEDQRERLYHTRTLFVNWTSNQGQPLKSALVPEQWERIIKDGKDIGYSYTQEEVDDTVHSPDGLTAIPIKDPNKYIIKIGTRTRIVPTPGAEWDTGTWMHTTIDRSDESWSSVAHGTNASKKLIADLLQIGTSDSRMKAVRIPNEPSPNGSLVSPDQSDTGPLGQGANVDVVNVRTLNVHTTLNKTDLDPFSQDVPVFYVPQAISSLLPRLLPLNHPQTFMVGTFVPTPWTDLGKGKGGGRVMSRYLDVLPIQQVTFNGNVIQTVPVTDRIGLTGALTTNYLSAQGKFLGSVSTYSDGKDADGNEKMTTLTIVPTDAATLQRIWDHPNLTAPEEVPTGAGASSAGIPAPLPAR